MTTTTTSKGRDSRSLLADDSGATMVMGVFMAMMVVGMIYYVWGLGGTIIHRERMQDAADAAAFGASVFQARGMNIIAMLNVLMSVFAIIGTACRLLHTFIIATAAADDAACAACLLSVVCIPGAAEFCEPAAEHDIELAESGWLTDVADMCDNIVSGIHGVQVVVRTGAMVAAEGYVLSMLPSRYRPTVTEGVFIPGSFSASIQSEDDTSEWACHHGITMMFVRGPALALVLVGEAVLFEPIFSVGVIAGEIAVGVEEFETNSGSNHYCHSSHFQRVPTSSWLGEQNFQSYSIVYGTPPFGWVTNGVAIGNWGRTTGTAPSVMGLDVSVVGELQRLSFADSEYYFEDTEDHCTSHWHNLPDAALECAHQEWLWHTRWRARMRRFHAGTNVTGRMGTFIQGVLGVVVH